VFMSGYSGRRSVELPAELFREFPEKTNEGPANFVLGQVKTAVGKRQVLGVDNPNHWNGSC
jgi:hypothetical protein